MLSLNSTICSLKLISEINYTIGHNKLDGVQERVRIEAFCQHRYTQEEWGLNAKVNMPTKKQFS